MPRFRWRDMFAEVDMRLLNPMFRFARVTLLGSPLAACLLLIACAGGHWVDAGDGHEAHGKDGCAGEGPARIAVGTWTLTGSLNVTREDFTATRLPDGKALAAGGAGPSGVLAGAEVYDAATGVWSRTGSMGTARIHHAAARLRDGRVLVVGGNDGSNFIGKVLSSAEIYDPATGAWSPTGSMTVTRYFPMATALSDGRVLVTGGVQSAPAFNPLASAEVYDPATGVWTPAGSMSTPRVNHTAVLLANGKVLVAGGARIGTYLASAELYDPVTGAWTSTGSMNSVRGDHTATLLRDGKVLAAAGYDGNNAAVHGGTLDSAEVYDPVTGVWTPTAAMRSPHNYAVAARLPDGKVLVAGGVDGSAGAAGILAAAEVYDPVTGKWTSTGSMNVARAAGPDVAATPLGDGDVLIEGGVGTNGQLGSAEVYHGCRCSVRGERDPTESSEDECRRRAERRD